MLAYSGYTLGIADDVKFAGALGHQRPKFSPDGKELEGILIQYHLSPDPAIHVHLVVLLPGGLHLHVHRMEGHGDRGRSPEHLAEQLGGVRVAAGGDGPHVPDHLALGV